MGTPVFIPVGDAGDDMPVRGIGWVLRMAAAAAAIVLAAVILLEFGYRMAAEQALCRAAKAGLREAALPRASRASIERTIRGRLDARLGRGTKVSMQSNVAAANGEITIALAAPANATLPDWLELLTVWNSRSEVTARVVGSVSRPR